jgi:hypothetical protein
MMILSQPLPQLWVWQIWGPNIRQKHWDWDCWCKPQIQVSLNPFPFFFLPPCILLVPWKKWDIFTPANCWTWMEFLKRWKTSNPWRFVLHGWVQRQAVYWLVHDYCVKYPLQSLDTSRSWRLSCWSGITAILCFLSIEGKQTSKPV